MLIIIIKIIIICIIVCYIVIIFITLIFIFFCLFIWTNINYLAFYIFII